MFLSANSILKQKLTSFQFECYLHLKRRKEVIKKYNEISFQIHECFEKMNKTILYIPIIDSINIDNIQNFLNNPKNIINQIKPPKPILSNFCQKLNSKVFTFNLIDKNLKHHSQQTFFGVLFFQSVFKIQLKIS